MVIHFSWAQQIKSTHTHSHSSAHTGQTQAENWNLIECWIYALLIVAWARAQTPSTDMRILKLYQFHAINGSNLIRWIEKPQAKSVQYLWKWYSTAKDRHNFMLVFYQAFESFFFWNRSGKTSWALSGEVTSHFFLSIVPYPINSAHC